MTYTKTILASLGLAVATSAVATLRRCRCRRDDVERGSRPDPAL